MKIMHLIKTNGIAGAEGHLLILLPGLIARGFDVRVVFIAPVNGEGADFAAALEKSGVPVERLPIRGNGTPALMWKLRGILRRHAPDVAHIHLFHAELWGIPAAKLAGVPRIFASRHNEDPRRAKAPLRWIYRALWALTDTGICISEAVRRAVEAEGAPPRKLRVVHYGLPDIPRRDTASARENLLALTGFPPDSVLFGTVSRLLDIKGIDDAIRALASLPDSGARMVIAGDGPYRAQLEAEVARSGVGARVAFIGWQPDAAQIMAGLDVLLSPSHREGFGMSVVEAMAQGVPVIASRAGALPEIVADGETGLLVPPKSPDALAAAMRKLAADPDLRRAMGDAGLRRVREVFTADRMIDATAGLYRE